MQRVIVPQTRFRSDEIAPGVFAEAFYPGGKDGPAGECLRATPGGQGWTDNILLGGAKQDFQLMWPDIRLPANQYWPLHWHDCWTAVVLVEGQLLIGDWWMEPSDVFITRPKLEYGPLVVGPQGARLFEIFASAELAPGGYAPEYHDHPTLQGTQKVFLERSVENQRNAGRMSLPCEGVEGAYKSRLTPGALLNLGAPDDPERGVLQDRRLDAGEWIAPHRYEDWHLIAVMDGSFTIAGRTIARDGFLRIAPDVTVPKIVAGEAGARLLECARTARGADRIRLSQDQRVTASTLP
ncbi:MAG: hypothetical protein QM676_06860 [Novosphingobium sp.]